MIRNFDGNTFVAYLDISGFKELMKNKKKALEALDRFYHYGYNELRSEKAEGLFVSDCGILFVREDPNTVNNFVSFLNVIKRINLAMLEHEFMLTTSIAYGHFRYQERIEFEGIEKNALYGSAYVSAYLDNDFGTPKIQPGQCRILVENLPNNIREEIQKSNDIFGFILKRGQETKHYYYYWNIDDFDNISKFEKTYKNAYDIQFKEMIKALKFNW